MRFNGRLLALAFLAEGGLLVAGMFWILLRGLPFAWGEPVRSTVVGLAVAGGLAVVQYGLLRHAPAIGPVRALRRLYRELLFPMFRQSTPIEIVTISLLAGLGEEMFFRGAMQPEWGWVIASLTFGACHVGGRSTIVLGIWAACTGALLAWVAILTGGLLAPILAHAVYDALALSYLRWGPAEPIEAETEGVA